MSEESLKGQLQIRPLGPEDSLEELTQLLHRAYAEHARQGRTYMATTQTVEQTRQRLADSECFVASIDGRIVGTFSIKPPKERRGLTWYAQAGVARASQIAVDADLHGRGIGATLIDAMEQRGRDMGAIELALDTSRNAKPLVKMYLKLGYRIVDHTYWANTNYCSVVMSKQLQEHVPFAIPWHRRWWRRQRAHVRQVWYRLHRLR